MVKVAVIGAGVVGLSSALNIRRMVLDSHVTIIADQFHDLESHSNVGIAKPSMELLGGLSEMTIKSVLPVNVLIMCNFNAKYIACK